jgi:hypothetical protein
MRQKQLHNTSRGQLTPRIMGTRDLKNIVDVLRLKLSKENLRKIILSAKSGYRLDPEVKVFNSDSDRLAA